MSPENLADTADYQPSNPSAVKRALPPTSSVRVDLAARTDRGKVRPNNEDNFHVVQFGRYLRTLLSSLPDGSVPGEAQECGYGIAVADGMGGHAAGEVASRIAIMWLIKHVLKTPDWILGREEPYMTEALDRAAARFQYVNDAVLERAETEPGLKGMGTTLSLAVSLGDELIIAHVGDSPIFLSRRGKLHRLTRDHTLGQQLSNVGASDADRFRHILTRAIGMDQSGAAPDVQRCRLFDGDRLLLCTDGLTEMVDDETIASVLQQVSSAADACRVLIDLALDRGGNDNVTAVVAGYCIPAA
jgi:protein phosphatase